MTDDQEKPPREFDWERNPAAIPLMDQLEARMRALPPECQLYALENYAARRGLLRGCEAVRVKTPDGREHLRPTGGHVVMPGFGRLVECWRACQDRARKRAYVSRVTAPPAAQEPPPPKSAELPF